MIKNNDYIVIIRFQSIFLVEMHLKLIFSPAFQYAIFCRQSCGGWRPVQAGRKQTPARAWGGGGGVDQEGGWGLSEEGRGGVCQVVLARRGGGQKGRGWLCVCTVKMPPRGGIFTVLLLRPSLCSTDNIKKLRIILKLILHSICVFNYAKVYVKHNIFHKKSKYMTLHVLLSFVSAMVAAQQGEFSLTPSPSFTLRLPSHVTDTPMKPGS